MTPPADVFGLTELIEGFTFRNQGGIKILKKWREEAVIMQLDVEIVSVARNQFVNYRSLPASGSYGYATLVFRDFCLPSIQLTQSRQTIYYATNEFAQTAWMNYHQALYEQGNFKNIEDLICVVTGILGGACLPKECVPFPVPSFIEFPLREVFIKTDLGTQFNVELSYWKINDVLDNCGNLVSPKSNQNDADKDEGLPPFGTSPSKAQNPSNPFAGLPPVSPWDREGIISDSRLNDLDDTNPDNLPEPDVIFYDVSIYAQDYINGCAGGLFEIFYPVAEGLTEVPTFSLNTTNTFTACGLGYRTAQVIVNGAVVSTATGISSSLVLGVVPYTLESPVPDGFYYGWRLVT